MGKKPAREAGISSSASESSSSDERDKKRRKSDKMGSDKKEKHSKAKKHKDKGKKHKDKSKDKPDLVKQAKNYLKAHLEGDTPAPGQSAEASVQAPTPIDEKLRISEADYFTKNNEFTVWLQEELRLFYNDLDAEQTHDFFSKFVELWNSGRLAQKYYAGAVAAPARRTAHQWKFKKSEERASEKMEQRRWNAEQKEQLNELLPKATGREGRIEERIGRREEAKAREASPDLVRLPGGGDIYGGDDSIAAARAREASRQSARRNRQLLKQEEVSHRVAAAQAKEDEKMAAFRALVQQGPIQIRKRD